MRRFPWWLFALGVGLVLAAGGGYVVTTRRQTGPRWERMLPEARAKAEALLREATAAGLEVMFWDGWRSPEDSQKNIDAGTSRVTDPFNSLHVWGAAFDIVFRNTAGLPYWPPDTDPRWRELAQIGRRLGLYSGGLHWGWDWPHFQLPSHTIGVLRASYGNNYLAFLQSNGVAVA